MFDKCKKCGGRYISGPRYSQDIGGFWGGGEWLVYTCSTCGYEWRTRTVDYERNETEDERAARLGPLVGQSEETPH